jgi:chromosome segregation ATPase
MHLKELTINGFKSFARKSELEFTTPITAIVGPNGSGKSNVAEAFRFVLGEQSVKSMRGKRGEDLIFNGSESVSRSNRASVSITLLNPLKNGTRVFPLDFDEISVERVVHRDGTNEYSINGSKVRLKDVQELLASANIGPTGHHIISQGEADRILSANGKERREMIEDALGLKVFQFKKTESERKLKKTEENIAQVESLRREVAPHLKFLEKQIKKIERSLALQEELKQVYADYLKREDTYIAYHHDRLTHARIEPRERLQEIENRILEARTHMNTQVDDGATQALMRLEENMSATRRRRQEHTRAIGQLEGQLLFIDRQIGDANRRAQNAEDIPIPRATFIQTLNQIEQKVREVAQSTDIHAIINTLKEIASSLRSLLVHTSDEKDSQGTRQLEVEKDALVEEKRALEEMLEHVGKDEATQQQEYNAIKEDIERHEAGGREAERTIFTLMQEQRTIEQTIDRIDRELAVLERDRVSFKEELQEAVSLIGRSAGMYFEQVVVDNVGVAIPQDVLVNESREVQYGRRRELERMKIRLEELGTGSNEDVLKEYKEVKERDEFLAHEIVDLRDSVAKLQALITELTNDLNLQFVEGIDKINTEFKRFFTLMFGGGSADLLRVRPKVVRKESDEIDTHDTDVDEEQEEGIDIDVKLPNKKVRGLEMLSGGERALTSIALIFAMSQVNPPLFVILDETDAALDEANSRRYGDMISALAQKSQLILITHNRETMGRAGVLYGVTMAGDGVSKLLSVKFDEAVAVAK